MSASLISPSMWYFFYWLQRGKMSVVEVKPGGALLADLGKPTMRGIRKCPKCSTFNGTRWAGGWEYKTRKILRYSPVELLRSAFVFSPGPFWKRKGTDPLLILKFIYWAVLDHSFLTVKSRNGTNTGVKKIVKYFQKFKFFSYILENHCGKFSSPMLEKTYF